MTVARPDHEPRLKKIANATVRAFAEFLSLPVLIIAGFLLLAGVTRATRAKGE